MQADLPLEMYVGLGIQTSGSWYCLLYKTKWCKGCNLHQGLVIPADQTVYYSEARSCTFTPGSNSLSTTLPEQSPSKHLLQRKSATYPLLPEIPLHLLRTHLWQATHIMELSPTPCLHTPHGYFPESSALPIPTWHLITFVLPMFTLRSFNSYPSSIYATFPSATPRFLRPEQDHLHTATPWVILL